MISPYNLPQEHLVDQPHPRWRIMMYCVLEQVDTEYSRSVATKLFEMCPGPMDFIRASEGPEYPQLFELVKPLRYSDCLAVLRGLSIDYCMWKIVQECSGCNQYTTDCLGIFVHGRTDVITSDDKLNKYMDWKRGTQNVAT